MLSPYLFLIFFNTLVEKINKNFPKNIIDLEFADNLAIFASNKYYLRKTIEVIDEWCKEYRMNLNKKKCSILRISRK